MMTLPKPIFVMNEKLDLKACFNNNITHHSMAIHPGKIHRRAPGKPGSASQRVSSTTITILFQQNLKQKVEFNSGIV
jgi:hypothetical protein